MRQNPEWVKFMKEQYPPGTRIHLMEMRDPFAPVPSGTEGTVNFVDDAGQLQMEWDNGRTLALIPGEDQFSIIPQPLHTLKLYMPLTVTAYVQDEWGDIDDTPVEPDRYAVLAHEDSILAALLKERRPEEAERGLMEYYGKDDDVNRKVQSYVFTAEEVDGCLMGVAECRVRGELTDTELEQLKEYVSGQAPDGFGEGFEQRPIKAGDGELYIHLWNSDNSWSIQTRDELEQGQQMGGITLGS